MMERSDGGQNGNPDFGVKASDAQAPRTPNALVIGSAEASSSSAWQIPPDQPLPNDVSTEVHLDEQDLGQLCGLYDRLPPGGLVRVRVGDPGRKATVRSALFHAGFVDTRWQRNDGALVGTAKRDVRPPPAARRTSLSVVMPVFNEKATFRQVIDELLAKRIQDVDIDVVIVESNSVDGTRDDVLLYRDHPDVTVILEDRPQGKGHAVRRGLESATGDFILIQDADCEYSLDDYEKLLAPLRSGVAAFVMGCRHSETGHHWRIRDFRDQKLQSVIMNLGHLGFLTLFNVVFAQRLRDPFTMYKVFRRDCLDGLTLECDRFDFDWELVIKLIRTGFQPIEIPVSYRSRSFDEGKKISMLRDSLTWIRACFKYRLQRID